MRWLGVDGSGDEGEGKGEIEGIYVGVAGGSIFRGISCFIDELLSERASERRLR